MTIPGTCPRCLQRIRSKAHYGAHIRWSPSCRLTPAEVLVRYVPERPEEPRECWLWRGTIKESPESRRFYGALSYEGRHWQAHRWVYTTFGPGTIPPGHDLEHLCNVTECVRPEHLLAVDRREHFRRTRARVVRDAAGPAPW